MLVYQQGTLRKKQEGKKHKKSSSVNPADWVRIYFAKSQRRKWPLSILFLSKFINWTLGLGNLLVMELLCFDRTRSLKQRSYWSLVKNIASISITYSDGNRLDWGRLLRASVGSDAISDNLKGAIIATEDEHLTNTMELYLRLLFVRLWEHLLVWGRPVEGSTLTQQVIKQRSCWNAPTLARKAADCRCICFRKKWWEKVKSNCLS